MEMVGHVWRVKPGKADEYDLRHAKIWPELARLFIEAGVRNYHIYRWGDLVFSHLEVEDYDGLVARFAENAVAARWEDQMAELIEYPAADPRTGWPERIRHVWSLTDNEVGVR